MMALEVDDDVHVGDDDGCDGCDGCGCDVQELSLI